MFGFQNLEADLSSLKMYIRVEDTCQEFDLRWALRVVLTDIKLELEPAVTEWRVRWTFNIASPLEHLVFASGLQYDVAVFRSRNCNQLLRQSFPC